LLTKELVGGEDKIRDEGVEKKEGSWEWEGGDGQLVGEVVGRIEWSGNEDENEGWINSRKAMVCSAFTVFP